MPSLKSKKAKTKQYFVCILLAKSDPDKINGN